MKIAAFSLIQIICLQILAVCSPIISFAEDTYMEINVNVEIFNDGSMVRREDRLFKTSGKASLNHAIPVKIDTVADYEKLQEFNVFNISDISEKEVPDVAFLHKSLKNGVESHYYKIDPDSLDDSFLYRTIIFTKPALKGSFWISVSLDEEFPIRNASLTVSRPKVMPFYYQEIDMSIKPIVTEKEDTLIYRWNVSEQKSLSPIIISSSASWSDLSNWLASEYSGRMRADDSIMSLVDNNPSELFLPQIDLIRFYHNYIAMNFAKRPAEGIPRSVVPNYSDDVFKVREGDCKDLSVLLVTLLKAASIEAHPLLMNSNDSYDFRMLLPSPSYFNHAIVIIPEQRGIEKTILIDPANRIHYSNVGSPTADYGLMLLDNKGVFIEIDRKNINRY